MHQLYYTIKEMLKNKRSRKKWIFRLSAKQEIAQHIVLKLKKFIVKN